MSEYRVIRVPEAPYDDGSPTGRYFTVQQVANSRDPYTGELDWEDMPGTEKGPYDDSSA